MGELRMSILLVTHESSSAHITPSGHPERVDRLRPVIGGARAAATEIVDLEAPVVDRGILELVHTPEYIAEVAEFCARGGGGLDPDTYVVPASFMAALHAAGAGPAAVESLAAGDADAGFVVVRPPGHHALEARAMGFCIFNNIAITAAFLRQRGERVAIVDWDVHHGNGTQDTFYGDPDVLYVSVHEFPFYPGTGWIGETGEGLGTGTTVNVPLPGGTTAASYLAAFARIVLPVVEQFSPDWILISNGYDAHRLDPIGGLMLESSNYGWLAKSIAEQLSTQNVIAFLEGGYDLSALRESSTATVEGLAGNASDLELPVSISGAATRMVDLAIESLSPYWELR
jgi:acetoin utilization deacetylase AcuC-like enzyme